MTVDEAMRELHGLDSSWWFSRLVAVVSLTTSLLAVESNMLTYLSTCSEDQWDLGDWQIDVLVIFVVLGIFLGTVLLGPLADIWGRVPVIQWSTVAVVVFGLASALSPSFPLFVLLRTCSAFFEGAWVVATTFVIEMAPQDERGVLALCSAVAWGAGSLGVTLVAWLMIPTLGWRWFTGAVTIPFIFALPFLTVLCESPRWLVCEGRQEEAMETLERLASLSGVAMPCSSVVPTLTEQTSLQKPPSPSTTVEVLWKYCANYAALFNEESWLHTVITSTALLCLCTSYNGVLYFETDVLASTSTTSLLEIRHELHAGLQTQTMCDFSYKFLALLATSELVIILLLMPFTDRPHIPLIGGRRGVMRTCWLLALIPTVLSGYSTIPGQTVWTYLSRGLIQGGYSSILITIPELYPASRRVTAIAFATALSYAGIAIACWVVFSDLSNVAMMWIMGVFLLLVVVLVRQLPETAKVELK